MRVERKTKKRRDEWKKIEEFARKQIEKYVKIHKEHEKDLRYIG
jgi:hypothetical protein